MNLLAFDTSTEACSAALLIDDEIISRYEMAPRRHTELILPMIDDVLNEAGTSLSHLDAIAFGCGPGAFTGVRLTAGIAQGLAYSTGIPLLAVSSLASLAQSVNGMAAIILVAIDARMGEIYQAFYRSGQIPLLLGKECVIAPDAVKMSVNDECYGVGSGWQTYADILREKTGENLKGIAANNFPDARHMLQLALHDFEQGRLLTPEQAAPAYLRDKVTG